MSLALTPNSVPENSIACSCEDSYIFIFMAADTLKALKALKELGIKY